jgi:redox-sensitive bicupin YhaK (pirin superfamily)
MIRIRRSLDRGRADHGWLDSRFTFSFADYHDPKHMCFRALRVINDDRISPSGGFPMHPHRDMEIVTYVVEGAIAHRDSLGNGSVIRPGEVQRMTAGKGVVHSEYNPSDRETTRLLQIWILPRRNGLEPGYEQKAFPESERRGALRVVASPDGRDGSVTIQQDAAIYAGRLGAGESVRLDLAPGRHAWVHVVRGDLRLGGHDLSEGDGAAVSDEGAVQLEGRAEAEVLVFDLA